MKIIIKGACHILASTPNTQAKVDVKLSALRWTIFCICVTVNIFLHKSIFANEIKIIYGYEWNTPDEAISPKIVLFQISIRYIWYISTGIVLRLFQAYNMHNDFNVL